ncbi:MAG: TRAP transporter fused permease subunit, partial [Smithellaceae bacterium]|nr:TRAP transporter fused permease subunit [Smithellaceae bacterium]
MRELTGFWKVVTGILIGIWSVFLVYTALTLPLHSLLQGGISLAFGLALVFILYPLNESRSRSATGTWADKLVFGTKNTPSALDLLFILLSVTPCLYVMLNWEAIARAVGRYEDYQLVMGAVLALLLLEGTRRALGYAIPIVVIFFFAYAMLGQYMPGFFGHAGYSLPEVLYQIFLMTEGVWGLLTDMTSRVIALFIIFGPVLFAAGVGKTFMDISMVVGGRTTGGAGQIAVVSSAFFGMLSGSSVANVATTGSFTIPTMKKLGYRPELAGAIEASASSGGQIMPPIMGAGAFIIAEFLNISYLKVMSAALIPAIIYFVGIWAGVYVEAKRDGLGKLPLEMIPKFKEVFTARAVMMFFIPVGLLLVLLFMYLPPQLCAAWALISVMVLFIFTGTPLTVKGLWHRTKHIAAAYYDGVSGSLAWLMVMMSCVQMAVTMISLSGFGVKLSEVIMALADVNIFLALLATMVASMLLGMGMTTTAAYVIAAAVLAPALGALGLPILAGHLFIFWFAIKSGLTPPVCIAVFTAAAISGGNWLRLAWIAMRLGIGGYIMPFFFIFFPVFLMEGPWFQIAWATALAMLAMFPLQASLMGYWLKPTTILERVLFMAGG